MVSKLLKIVLWAGVTVLGVFFALVVWYVVAESSDHITSDLAKAQVVNLNQKLAADEVCIFDVGVLASAEIHQKYPGYTQVAGSDMLHEPTAYWSVVGLHHNKKEFEQYLVDRGVVILTDSGSFCSSAMNLRVE